MTAVEIANALIAEAEKLLQVAADLRGKNVNVKVKPHKELTK